MRSKNNKNLHKVHSVKRYLHHNSRIVNDTLLNVIKRDRDVSERGKKYPREEVRL